MKIINTPIAGLRLNMPFQKPMVGDTYCLVTINKGVFQVNANGTISHAVESTNSERQWVVEIGCLPANIGQVREYSDDMMSITCILGNVELAKSLLDEYMLEVELTKLRQSKRQLRQHQNTVKIISQRIDIRKEDK